MCAARGACEDIYGRWNNRSKGYHNCHALLLPRSPKAILDGNDAGETPKIPLVGLAVGDPCTDNEHQEESMDMLWCVHYSSLI